MSNNRELSNGEKKVKDWSISFVLLIILFGGIVLFGTYAGTIAAIGYSIFFFSMYKHFFDEDE